MYSTIKILLLLLISCVGREYCIASPINIIFQQLDTCLSEEAKNMTKNESINDIGIFRAGDWEMFNKYNPCFKQIINIVKKDNDCIIYFAELLNDEHDGYIGEIYKIVKKNYHHYLNNIKFDFDREIDSLRELKKFYDARRERWKTADTIDGFYIPKDIYEAISELNRLLDSERIAIIINHENEEFAEGWEHNNLGMFIRRIWKIGGSRLLSDSEITNSFYKSDLIIVAYYRYLHGKPINLEELIEKYKQYQEKYDNDD